MKRKVSVAIRLNIASLEGDVSQRKACCRQNEIEEFTLCQSTIGVTVEFLDQNFGLCQRYANVKSFLHVSVDFICSNCPISVIINGLESLVWVEVNIDSKVLSGLFNLRNAYENSYYLTDYSSVAVCMRSLAKRYEQDAILSL